MKLPKIDLQQILEGLRPSRVRNIFFDFLSCRHRAILSLVFVSLMGYAGFIWYRYIYNYYWTVEQKEQYIKSKDTGVVFEKSRFYKLIEKEEERKKKREENIGEIEDIFRLNK